MEGIHWLDLFSAADRFILATIEHYGAWIYATLFLIFFSETGLVFMAFLPGDSLLFVAGAIAGSGKMNVGVLIAVVFAGAFIGNTVNYTIGTWLGHKVYDGTIRWIDRDALRRTHDFYERWGGITLVIARFVPVVRTFAPLVAGVSEMTASRFQIYNAVGAALWVLSLVLGGYLFGNIPFVKDNLGLILIVGLAGAVVPITAAALWRASRGLRLRRAAGAAVERRSGE